MRLRRPPQTLPFLQRASERLADFMERRGRALLCINIAIAIVCAWRVLRGPAARCMADLAAFQPGESSAFLDQETLTGTGSRPGPACA